MMNKKLILIGLLLIFVLLLSGCTSYVSNDIAGTLKTVKKKGDNEIVVEFYNDSIAKFTFSRYTDDNTQDWYKILNDYIDERIRLVWVIANNKIIIASIELKPYTLE